MSEEPRPVILCFAGDAWDGNPHSRHHLMRRFADRFDVLFVEGVPMRSLARRDPYEWRRAVRKLRAGASVRTVSSGLHVMRPWPIPPAGALGRLAQSAILRRQVEAACARLGFTGPRISWFSVPIAAPLRGSLGEHGSVFYYQDRYDAFSHVDGELLRAHIAELAGECDVSIATARALADDLKALGADPIVAPHGVDVHRFRGEPPPPADLAGLERPLIGCVGLIDEHMALDALVDVANQLERGTVVVVGASNIDTSQLRHPRIVLLGPRPYEAIPAYIASFATCLVPFAVSRLTEGVNPIKLREYLAAGRPVVATALPEIVPYRDVVELVGSPEEFAEAVTRTLKPGYDNDQRRERRRRRVAGESWDRVAARIEEHLWDLVGGATRAGLGSASRSLDHRG